MTMMYETLFFEINPGQLRQSKCGPEQAGIENESKVNIVKELRNDY